MYIMLCFYIPRLKQESSAKALVEKIQSNGVIQSQSDYCKS